jgi:hypothetical protein
MKIIWPALALVAFVGGTALAQKISQFTNEPGAAALATDAVVTESQNCPLSNGQPGNCRTTIQQIINTPGSAYYAPIGTGITWGQISGVPTTLTGYGVPTTGSGDAVQATSPSLVTPALGTPTSINLTNATSLPCAAMPALTGSVTTSAGSCATTGGGLGTPVATTGAGTTQGTARAITANVTIFTTVTAGQGGILTLPYSAVINAGANTLLVYPNSGAAITGGGTTLSTNAAFSIAPGSWASFACPSSTACYAMFVF